MDQLEHNSGLVAHSDLTISRVGSLTAIINRIEEAVETETAAIRTDMNFDLRASNARKSRCLYELNRAIKNITAEDLVDEHKEGLLRLRGKLERNEAALLAHLSAVSEVANLMKNAIQHAEADGTYSAGEFGWAKS
ncbi:hypothetical protein ACHMW4_09745 [Mesorhizobium sp. UC22_110]|jgi:hypothetical protein|uniref:hypothetical protein n=2 Tax=Mesorhizobium TaxID=68287 RepID=UPI001012DA57|nr:MULTISPECIES: hypothetical protein [unclassified Mesorhizobium]MBR2686403.1 hypothetical protein [Aquamicrobium sp.]QAZ44596.1 hypothetical protein C1M53_18280 [Mesorhizobium sp. Pch-S]HEV2507099.1 hypothetical protein [Mesorhizobium sp.]